MGTPAQYYRTLLSPEGQRSPTNANSKYVADLFRRYSLSYPAADPAVYDIDCMRRFEQLELSDAIPDEISILNFND
ncbi:MAG: hypothetical protein QS748_02610 [Candidatus Endonucleobacter bathymodioli]|uniref:Uncharacterized protein n=1 Tax=Candidatus Endonucleibacter bathymodioli TaxID=539814 RepID=A0AA90NK54_9GAMM|nr:hypothetical protein [Candidatus Endonucleobacter bathymodioli]